MTRTHLANGIAFFALSITGILLLPAPFSGLREILLGGRFETVVDIHLWASVPFVLTLAVVYVLRGWKILRLRRITPLVGWKKLNSILALALSALLIVTGVVLWINPEAAAGWMEISRSVHTWSTWAVIPWVLLHAGVETARWLRRLQLSAKRSANHDSNLASLVSTPPILPLQRYMPGRPGRATLRSTRPSVGQVQRGGTILRAPLLCKEGLGEVEARCYEEVKTQ